MGAVIASLRGLVSLIPRRRGMVGPVALLLLLPFLPWFGRPDIVGWLVGAAILAGLAVAFDFTAGYINIVNFGFAAFSGAGGYTSALVAIHTGLSPWLTVFVGAAVAGLLGLATGVLTLRFRGIYAAVVAWFLSLALLGLTRNLTSVTRGSLGLSVPTLLTSASNKPYYFIVVGMLAISYIVLKAVTETHAGLAFRAMGQNLDAARASGINPTRYRILNFTLSCAFAGWFGAFYAHYYSILTPDIMSTPQTVQVIVVAYIGGRGSLWGPATMAFPFILLDSWLRSSLSNLPGLNLVIFGAILILGMVFYPGGFAELATSLRARIRRRPLGNSSAFRSTGGRLRPHIDIDPDPVRPEE